MARRPHVRIWSSAVGALVVAATACVPVAQGHEVKAHARLSERQLERVETAELGPEHAREHAAERKALRAAEARLKRMTPAQRRATRAAAERAHARARLAALEPADQVGRWDSTITIDLPTYAINAVMLPTGKVAYWGRAPLIGGKRENSTRFFLLDPSTGVSTEHAPPMVDVKGQQKPAPLFCSGQSLLADGRLFVAGGTLDYPTDLGGETPDYQGLKEMLTFDPWTETWHREQPGRHGRWYPSQLELADGRILILSGLDETGAGGRPDNINPELEIYDPSTGKATYYPTGDRKTDLYPHLFSLPGGNHVLLGGPKTADTGILDLNALSTSPGPSAWRPLPQTGAERIGGNAVLIDGRRMSLIGGFYYSGADGFAVADSETLDVQASNPTWLWDGGGIPALNYARSYANTVQLPDGQLVTIGGGAGFDADGAAANYTADDQHLKQVELLRPGIDTAWTLGPAQRKWRAYHSTALLLPDGRILSAGDDYWHADDTAHPEDPSDFGEIYSPPYLYDGDDLAPRPVIDSAPSAAPYGGTFAIKVSNRAAGRAVLVAPAATTHGADMNQRVVPLTTIDHMGGAGLTVRAPSDAGLATPGYYMLFVLDETGAPSVARWLRLGVEPPATEPPAPSPPAPSPPAPNPPARDRKAPKIKVSLKRPRLRITLSEPGKATVEIRAGKRRIRRTLTFRNGALTRTLKLPRLKGTVRVVVRAVDASGNRSTSRKSYRSSRKVKRA